MGFEPRLCWLRARRFNHSTTLPTNAVYQLIDQLIDKDDAVYQLIESLWDSEFLKGTTVLDTPNSKEDRAAFHLMQDSVTIHKGHYQLPLLWRHSQVSLPNNYAIAKHRLTTLKRRFLSDPHLKAKYIDVINGYVKKG